MIRSIRSIKMLEGVRNSEGMSIAKLADYLTRVSMLVRDAPQISEIDLNPVKREGDHLSVVDCRIIIENKLKEQGDTHHKNILWKGDIL